MSDPFTIRVFVRLIFNPSQPSNFLSTQSTNCGPWYRAMTTKSSATSICTRRALRGDWGRRVSNEQPGTWEIRLSAPRGATAEGNA